MEVLIERLDYFGRGITYLEDKICFVKNALEGEIVEVKVTKKTKRYLEAEVVKYLKTSPNRVTPPCPYYNECGGCQLQHIKVEKENAYKTQKVKDLVKRIGNIDPEIVQPCINVNEYNYRNKLTVHILNKKMGLFQENTNNVIEIDKCLIAREELNDRLSSIYNILKEEDPYCKNVMLRVGNCNHDVIVDVNEFNIDSWKSLKYRGLYSCGVLKDGKDLKSEIGNYKFYASPNSFFQVNGAMTKVLYDEVLNYCKDNKVKDVLDLYCGTGTIGIYISKYVKNVLGIEINESCINDGKRNLQLNHVSNVKFICSPVEDYIDKIENKFDLVIVDPPRKGLDDKTINYLKRLSSKTIIYISCDPATLARDLGNLKDLYTVNSIKTFNMFVKTYHVESLAILTKH